MGPLAEQHWRRRLADSGIYYGWFVVLASFVGQFAAFGTIYSFGVFFGHIVDAFGLSHANTAVVYSFQSVVIYVGGAVLGIVIDRYDVRRLFGLGSVLLVLGMAGASQLGTFTGVVLSYGLVAGVGIGLLYVIAYTAPVRWFERRRGLALGVATAGGGLGILTMAPLSSWLIARLGWQTAYLYLSTGLFVVLALATVVLAESPDALADASSSNGDDTLPAESLRSQLSGAWKVASSPAFGLVLVGYLLGYTPVYVFQVHLVEHATVAGIGRSVGVLAVSVWGVANVVGKLSTGHAADRLRSSRVVIGSALVLGAVTIGIGLVGRASVLLGLMTVFAVTHAGLGALMSVLISDLFGQEYLSTLFGFAGLAFALTGSVAPYLAGLSYDSFGTYTPAFVVAGLCCVLASAVLFAATRIESRPA
ncbi:MFS transporter [Haloarculaceae archaeon H-GB11]|nr:MFS transporter [Haloarculaceae archaeon H-GB11]